jgi:hypothetical protein
MSMIEQVVRYGGFYKAMATAPRSTSKRSEVIADHVACFSASFTLAQV